MIDWSAASSPARAGAADSIWFGFGQWNGNTFSAVSYEQQLTRADARTRLAALLAGWQKDQRRVLVGLDFAFGYPKGTAAALGLQGSAWKAIHDAIANSVSDNAQNTHTGAQFASDCNGRVLPAGQPGPFWGCSVRDQVPGRLEQRRVGVFAFPYGPSMLGQWRITDTRAAHRAVTQSVWKLNCGVSVGMQTIVGIKHLAEASRAIGSSARIWPFETGFSAPEKPGVWFAEIFPSIVTIDESVVSHQPLDCRQVESCVLEAAMRDCRGEMVKTLGAPSGLSQAELATVTGEEGWMLFL
jgi:precorrin-8X/cobalt-precorrin-8 methylmutase